MEHFESIKQAASLITKPIKRVDETTFTVPRHELFNFLSQRYRNEFPSIPFKEFNRMVMQVAFDGSLVFTWTDEIPC